jgi:hypothetical protein
VKKTNRSRNRSRRPICCSHGIALTIRVLPNMRNDLWIFPLCPESCGLASVSPTMAWRSA